MDYVGSITIDKELLLLAKMKAGQKVDVLNITNGERFQTYIIEGEKGSREICINGAAAHKAKKGHMIIVVAYAYFTPEEEAKFEPAIVFVDSNNNPVDN